MRRNCDAHCKTGRGRNPAEAGFQTWLPVTTVAAAMHAAPVKAAASVGAAAEEQADTGTVAVGGVIVVVTVAVIVAYPATTPHPVAPPAAAIIDALHARILGA